MEARTATWLAWLALAWLGLALVAAGRSAGGLLLGAGCALLAARLAATLLRPHGPTAAAAAHAAGIVVLAALAAAGLGLLPLEVSSRRGLLASAAAAQVFVAALAWDPRGPRLAQALLVTGHLAGAAGLALAARNGDTEVPPALLAWACGFCFLALAASWSLRARRLPQLAAWDVVFLEALVLAAVAAAANLLPLLRTSGPSAVLGWPALVAAAAGVFAFALLADPPAPPAALSRRGGMVVQVLLHGAVLVVLANALYLALGFATPQGAAVLLAVLAVWQLASVVMEYRAVAVSGRRGRRAFEVVPKVERQPLAVIVAAHDEADVLPASMAANLAVDWPLRFLLVPSARSTDGTVEVARALAAQHPDRVSVLVGTGGSKAEDLNAAWRQLRGPVALLLDADETIDEASLRYGLAALEARPDAGIVQGRKAARDGDATFFDRFVAAERRHSTFLDHPSQVEAFRAGHFAGSAALVRSRVPRSVGGWSARTLTEDIDLTLRLRLATSWRIAYEPRMVVHEAPPRDLRALLRQRTRWARGWAQCALRYLPRVLAQRRHLGLRRSLGYALQLLTAVSSLWSTLLVAVLMLRLAEVHTLPTPLAWALAILIFPARLIGYVAAALRDPVTPVRRPLHLLELVVHAYAWVVLGWLVQLHALYQELARAPATWEVTSKRRAAPGAVPAAV